MRADYGGGGGGRFGGNNPTIMSFRTVGEKWGLLGGGKRGSFTKVGQHVNCISAVGATQIDEIKLCGDFKRFLFIVFVKL